MGLRVADAKEQYAALMLAAPELDPIRRTGFPCACDGPLVGRQNACHP